MHFKLLHLSLKDLEYVRSDCDAAEREGRCAWAAAFRTATGFNKKYQLSIGRGCNDDDDEIGYQI